LLPGAAVEAGLDAEGFLEQVCVKASLPPTAWKEADVAVSTFEGRVIGGAFDPDIAAAAAPPSARVTAEGLARLTAHCADNLDALLRHRHAGCYTLQAPDGSVNAISLAVRHPDGTELARLARVSLRPGLPLQATLFGMVEQAAARLDATAVAGAPRLELTVLWDPAMHGVASDPDLRGFDPTGRALLVLEGQRTAWRYDPRASADALLAAVAEAAHVRIPDAAFVIGLAAASTEACVAVADVPRPRPSPRVRPPAVAGAFYPAAAADLSRAVDELLAAAGGARERRAAVMVPHAALRYSGRLAAAVYARVEIPDLVLVLAPRHHRLGADWAVAPHETWSLPGVEVASDPALARELTEAVPDLELDAVAHEREHAIEVQLPLLARVAPHARVVGIALGAGDAERCHELATGLARVLRARRERPLLVISTDLNHYASDAENRRLDAIVLDSVERLDAADLYRTVRERRISMCGLLPTVVALDTLQQLGVPRRPKRVGYATSAEAPGGDASRVVGYAGMLFG
jgi:AmmeMemoRadiSam system protein B